jgi:hypothetical protein
MDATIVVSWLHIKGNAWEMQDGMIGYGRTPHNAYIPPKFATGTKVTPASESSCQACFLVLLTYNRQWSAH